MSVISTRDQVPHIVRGAAAPGSPRQPSAGGGLTGQDVLRIIRKRKWLIMLSVLICFAGSGALTGFLLMYFPEYTATAFLAVPAPESPLETRFGVVGGETVDRIKMGLAQMARNEVVFQKTIDDGRVKVTQWYRDNIQDPITKIDSATDISPIRDTNLIKLSMRGSNRKEVAEIVNAWCEAFVTDATDSANTDRNGQITKISAERNRIKEDFDAVERDIANLANSDTTMIQGELNAKTNEINRYTDNLLIVKDKADGLKADYDQILEMERQGQLENHPEVARLINEDPLLRGLDMELQSQKLALSQLSMVDEKHRNVEAIRSRIQGLEKQVAEQEDKVRRQACDLVKGARERELRQATSLRDTISAQINKLQDEAKVLNADLKKIKAMTERRDRLRNDIELMDRKLLELRLLQRSAVPVYIRRLAPLPTQPSFPRWTVTLPLGLALGLVIGFGLAFLLELMDTSIKSPSDVSRRVDLPLLGMVPYLGDLDEEIADLRLAFVTNPTSLMGESFRQVRTTLQFSAPASQLRSLLVTSALPGDGRSTVSLNLAAATAHSGKKVLVIEANFRQPALHRLFPQTSEAGLSNVLVGQSPWKELVREVHPNLFVLAGGPMPPNPSELLGSDAMRTLLTEWSGEFDQVIFDGAPCVLVTDPAVLATLVDGVVLVVRASANTYGVVQRARDILGRVGARMLGVVLNGIRVTAGGYLRKNYRTYYEYHMPAEAQQTEPTQQLPR